MIITLSHPGSQPTGVGSLTFGLVLKIFMTGATYPAPTGGPGNRTIAADNTKQAVILAQIPTTG